MRNFAIHAVPGPTFARAPSRRVPALWLLVSCLMACSTVRPKSNESLGEASEALTTAQARILGFEAPTSDWTGSSGTVSATTTATQGTSALALATSGWGQIESTSLGSIGTFTSASYDLRFAAAAAWGETRLVVRAPSVGIYWLDLGGRSIAGLAPNTYHPQEFSIPPAVVDDLSEAADVQFVITVNGPSGTGPYLIDDLHLTATSSVSLINVSLTVPEGSPLGAIQLWGEERVELTNEVTGAESVVSLADAIVGNDDQVHRLLSFGELSVGHRSVIDEAAARSKTGPGTATRLILFDDPEPALRTVSWDAALPGTSAELVTLPPGATDNVVEGRYDGIQVFSNAVLSMGAGTYFLDSLQVEPDAVLQLSPEGSTIIYVLSSLDYKGRVAIPEGGRLAVVYLGTASTVLERNLGGTLVAPHAEVRLATPPEDPTHSGAFFAKKLLVSPQVVLNFIPPNVLVPVVTDDLDSCMAEIGSSATGERAGELDATALCGGFEDQCMAQMVANANVDRRAASIRLFAKDFSPARYLGVARDRTRKLRKARATDGYACDVAAGDDDRDLVPNSIDECPDTPPLTPTDDVGCTEALPAAPDPDQVGVILDQTGIAVAPACLQTPPPSAARPSKVRTGSLGFANEDQQVISHLVDFYFAHDRFEDGDCVSFYSLEVERRLIDETDANGRPVTDNLHLLPSLDHYNLPSQGEVRLHFEIDDASVPSAQDDSVVRLFGPSAYYRYRVQVINMAGDRSEWSTWSSWHFKEYATPIQ